MTKRKLRRFRENKTFKHLFEYDFKKLQKEPFHLKGKWNCDFFKNDHPIIVELGCGKGEYTLGLSSWYPERNFIGIDLKGARLWRGCKTVEEESIRNVAFIRTQIEFIEQFFAPDEISEIWITFPDPQLQRPRTKKRLTSPQFLARYRQVLKPGGIIHLKTDNDQFFEYSLNRVKSTNSKLLFSSNDVYHSDAPEAITGIQTYYEKMFLEEGKSIKYLKFELNQDEA